MTTEIRRLLPLSESCRGHVLQWRGEESTECQLPPRLYRGTPEGRANPTACHCPQRTRSSLALRDPSPLL